MKSTFLRLIRLYATGNVSANRKSLTLLLLLCSSFAYAQITPSAGIVYVRPGATGSGNGSDWSNATANLQGAINASGVSKVFVATGTYNAYNISMKDGVEIYGGFAPESGITDLSHQRIMPSPTNLTVGSIINGTGGRHVIYNDSVDYYTALNVATLLDGFTITGGNTGIIYSGMGLPPYHPLTIGAGIYNHSSNARFNNLVIRNNYAFWGGGGMTVDSGSNVSLSNSYIINNGGYYGAPGLHVNQYCDVWLKNVEISRNNTEHADGGFRATGILAEVFCNVYVDNSTVTNNTVTTTTSDDRTISAVNFAKVYIRNSVVLGAKSEKHEVGSGSTITEIYYLSSIVNRATGLYQYDESGSGTLVSYTHNDIFTDTTNHIFTPKMGSPLINGGSSAFYFGIGAGSTDLAGNPRVLGGTIDIGAFEYQVAPDASGIIYVKPTGTGTQSGSSWANAIGNLQTAINTPGVSKVFVAVGTYNAYNISMKHGVEIYGGFDPANGITDLSHSRIMPSSTDFSVGSIINGSGGAHVIYNSNVGYGLALGSSGLSLLDGFTLTGGHTGYPGSGTLPFAPHTIGAGIYNHHSTVKYNNLVIRNNFAYFGGGGMFVEDTSNVSISNVYIINNGSMFSGAAMYIEGFCNVEVKNAVISGNNVNSTNGAIFNSIAVMVNEVCNVTMTNVTIAKNTATEPYPNDLSINIINFSELALRNSILIDFPVKATALTDTTINSYVDMYASIVNTSIGLRFFNWSGTSMFVSYTPEQIFADYDNNFLGLKAGSPAIDAGHNPFFSGLAGAKDVEGNTRLVGSNVDMGAYEYGIFPDNSGIVYVKPVSSGFETGNSWANATDKLHEAIHALGVTKVFVAKGTYHVGDQSFIMKNNVEIYGGFDPDNGITNLTHTRIFSLLGSELTGSVLDGDLTRPLIWNDFTSGTALNNTAVLDGFTITRAWGANGAIYNKYASPTLNNLLITANNITGIYDEMSSPVINNSAIVHNTATGARGLYQSGDATAVLNNVTIAGNGSNAIAAFTYPMSGQGSVSINNSVIYGSITGSLGGNLTAHYSMIQGNAISGSNNADATGYAAANVFIDPTNGDYRIQYTSPAYNAGNNALFPSGVATTDLAGDPRIFYGTIDMGAYECKIRPDSLGIVYVKTTATGTGIGNSWANATDKIQYGIDANGTQKVFVKIGNYNIPDVATSFVMKNNVAIYGGFDPESGISDLSHTRIMNDTSATTGSILSGMLLKPVIWNYHSSGSPMNNTAVLDGFTIINGRNIGANGGGIFNLYASPTLRNLVIKNNKASYGAGIYNQSSSPQMTNIAFVKDTATFSGGGIYIDGGSPSLTNITMYNNVAALNNGGAIFQNAGTPTYTNVEIKGCVANVRGGAINIVDGSAIFNGLTMHNNMAWSHGGAIYNQSTGNITITNLDMQNNTAVFSGGGISNNAAATYTLNSPVVIKGNAATNGSGGGIYNQTGIFTITGLDMDDNTALNNGAGICNQAGKMTITTLDMQGNTAEGNGGGIYNNDTLVLSFVTADSNVATGSGGAMYSNDGAVNIYGLLAKNNSAANTGGIYNNNTRSSFFNAAIVNNTNGGLYNSGDTFHLLNSTISGNTGFGLSCLSGTTLLQNSIVYNVNGTHYEPQYSLVEGNTDLTNGNIDATGILPSNLFINPTEGDYHLLFNVPVWDKGSNELFPGLNPATSQGVTATERRLMGLNVDMGAYEFSLTPDGSARMYVRDTATGSGDGSSWANATNMLQDAIDANGTQQVWVAKGIYYTGQHSYRMRTNVDIYGGFDPDNGISDLSHSRIMPDTTGNIGSIIDGKNERTVFKHDYFPMSNFLQNARLDGFTIRNGNAGEGYGGGMHNGNNTQQVLANVVFKNNTAYYGGGMYNGGTYSGYAIPDLYNVTFIGNTANSGGAMLNNAYTSVDLFRCTMTGNAAVGGYGGLYAGNGGGICNLGEFSNTRATDIVIQNNTAIRGAAICNFTGATTITNGLITGNTAEERGAVYIRTNDVYLYNVTMADNENTSTVYEAMGDINMETDTLYMIELWWDPNYHGPRLEMYNSIIYDDLAPTMNVIPTGGWAIIDGSFVLYNNDLIRKNNLFKSGSLPFPLNAGDNTGNIQVASISDIFVNPSAGDYRLKEGSLAIDAGNSALYGIFSPDLPDEDLAGNPRVIDGIIDMGAFEFDNCIPVTVHDTIVACDSFSWIDGITYTASNDTASYTLSNSGGCDSTIMLHLTINPMLETAIAATICSNNVYSFGGNNLSVAGIYSDTLTAASGCDSIITLTLSVNPVLETAIAATICSNEVYSFGGNDLSVAGTYVDTLTAASGCDSVITLTLSVSPVLETALAATICSNEVYSFGGSSLSTAGIYSDTLTAASGCDSIITLTLSVNPVFETALAATICSNEVYSFGGNDLSVAGIYTDTLTAASGCDSVITLTLSVSPVLETAIAATICSNEAYSFGGSSLSVAGIYTDTLTAASGCDSVVTLTLSVNPVLETAIAATICSNDSYSFGGNDLSVAGIYSDTLTAASGCDSVITLTLDVNPVLETAIAATICSNDSYSFGGNDLSVAGVYTDTLTAASGCDSVITLTLSVNPVLETAIAATICSNDSYSFGGNDLSVAGVYSDTLTAASGCDSVITLTLNVNPVLEPAIAATICSNEVYSFGGNDLSVAGTYTDTLTAASGCDSVVTLTLSVNPAPAPVIAETLNPTTCGGNEGSITLNSLTAGAGYSIAFDQNGIPQNPQTLIADGSGNIVWSTLSSSAYSNIIVTDIANTCSASTPLLATLTDPQFTISATPSDNTDCSNPNGAITITSPLMSSGQSFVWHMGTETGSLVADASHSIVLDSLGSGSYTDIWMYDGTTLCSSDTIASVTVGGPTPSNDITPVDATDSQFQSSGTVHYNNPDCEKIVTINATNGSLGNVTAAVDVMTAPGTYNNEFYIGRVYHLSAENNTGGTVTLYFSDAEIAAYNTAVGNATSDYPEVAGDGSNITITAFHSVSGSGSGPLNYDTATAELIIPSSVIHHPNGYYAISFTVDAFSGFFGTTNSTNPLPVKRIDISAINLGATNRVDWRTTEEAVGDRFIVERSAEGKYFDAIGTADAKGIFSSRYSFVDANPINGINYYRIAMLNNDGSRFYSKVVQASLNPGTLEIIAYPNPVKEELTVKVKGIVNGPGTIILSDVSGRELDRALIESNGTATFRMEHLAQGMYILKFRDDNTMKTIKVDKK